MLVAGQALQDSLKYDACIIFANNRLEGLNTSRSDRESRQSCQSMKFEMMKSETDMALQHHSRTEQRLHIADRSTGIAIRKS